jgi:hypothetical protein
MVDRHRLRANMISINGKYFFEKHVISTHAYRRNWCWYVFFSRIEDMSWWTIIDRKWMNWTMDEFLQECVPMHSCVIKSNKSSPCSQWKDNRCLYISSRWLNRNEIKYGLNWIVWKILYRCIVTSDKWDIVIWTSHLTRLQLDSYNLSRFRLLKKQNQTLRWKDTTTSLIDWLTRKPDQGVNILEQSNASIEFVLTLSTPRSCLKVSNMIIRANESMLTSNDSKTHVSVCCRHRGKVHVISSIVLTMHLIIWLFLYRGLIESNKLPNNKVKRLIL